MTANQSVNQSEKSHVNQRGNLKSDFPILSDLEAGVSKLDRIGTPEAEIAAQMGVSVKTVQRRLRSAAHKRQLIARIIRLAHLGKGADEVMECLAGVADQRDRQSARSTRRELQAT